MDNKGRRFKTEENEPTRVFDVEPAESAPGKAEKPKRFIEKTDRQRAKEAKKVEKMMAKERSHAKAEESRHEAESAPEAEAEPKTEAVEDKAVTDQPTPDKLAEAPAADTVDAADNAESSGDVEASPDKDHADKERKKDERLKEKNSKKLKRLMEKNHRREQHADRDVLSYEDMPLDERDSDNTGSKRRFNKKRITIAVIILLVLVFVVYIFTNNDKLSLHNISNFVRYGIFNSDSDQRFPVTVQGESISAGNFRRMGQDLCYASDTKVQTLNNYGKRMLTVQHGFTAPVLVASSKYSLLYNLGGKGFQINGLDSAVYSGVAEHDILVADINDNGTYALVTQSDGYLSKLYVYDKDNTKVFAYSFASYYITSVSLNSDGRKAVLSGVSAHNGSEISSLYVLDFTKETPQQFVELEDAIIYDVQYLNDTYAAAVGNTAAYSLNTGNGSAEMTSYEGKTLTAFTVNPDTDTFSVSLSRSGDGRNCDIYSFNTNGTVSKSFSTDLKVTSISSYKGRVALLTPEAIYLYDKGGSAVSKADAGIDPQSVVLYTSSDAYVLDAAEIRSVSM